MEQRLTPVLERRDYLVTPSHEYEDPDTGKSREIDLHALRLVWLYKKEYDDWLNFTILGSCRNNHLPVILFTHTNPLRGIEAAMSIPKAGYPITVQTKNDIISIEEFLQLGEHHHYYTTRRIASQYCRLREIKSGKLAQLIADHGDLHDDLDSLVKAVNAEVVHLKPDGDYLRELRPEQEDDGFNINIIYPIVILAGDLYECRYAGKKAVIERRNHIVMLRRIQSRLIKDEIFVDFVQEKHFNQYLSLLEREFDFIAARLKANRRRLRRDALRELRDLARGLPIANQQLPSTGQSPIS